ncbi:TIGR03936 family radical SAM-associated protein [Propionimicrobium sp. PCR01-08-3]|uniref:TIGR03936 family radical SAM-associated protein n=1 Tax=Propionimicrobium sp. PCR01-08-3 TaxID=3052086 RepID=UPI00255CA57A|nr:TIGR03936 family radical SAM-associated protein [Propionimicrobium sp. PCR01-08-3]WIY83517.1 TIGR03936 family radical SAM-associated protein [Propionimicrobium sp. PCR01-08-3]
MQKLDLRHVKRGTARFASHRDFGRALERALRRAGVPMAYSSGFSPHPRISYAGAAPTGTASEAEYVELGLSERCDPDKVKDALNRALPPGFDVVAVVEAGGRHLPGLLQASWWRLELPGVEVAALPQLAGALTDADQVEVVRMTKKGERHFDVRPALVKIWASDGALEFVIRHGEPLVRPDDVAKALRIIEPELMDDLDTPRATRLAQGPLVAGEVGDPLK